MAPLTVKCIYMNHVFDSNRKIVSTARKTLKDVEYDTLVGTGLSGALIVPLIARALKKHWMIVRKPKDGSHSGRSAEGSLGDRWVFVDDFISSGATRSRVKKTIAELAQVYSHQTEFVGSYLYEGYGGTEPFFEEV